MRPTTSATPTPPQLRAMFRGQVITASDRDYDRARSVFYGGIDRRPLAVVRARDALDASRAVALARETGLELAVRGGGHSMAGFGVSQGGIVLDLSGMRGIELDEPGRTAWADAGLTAAELTAAAGARGLAVGFGDTGSVGIGGLTLGGGVGYLVRKHGLTIDSLLAADVITADGQLLRTDAHVHPDLFWAIRGGGGNFGAVTRFQFQLREIGEILGGLLVLPAEPGVVAGFIAAAEAAPDELSTIANVMPAPPMPFLPAEVHGRLVVLAMLVYSGDVQAGARVVESFRGLARPLADMVRPMRYPDVYPPEQGEYHPVAAGRTMFMDHVDIPEAELILDRLRKSTASTGVTQLRVLGGAMARVTADATAFAHRSSRIMVNVAALYDQPALKAAHEAWVEQFAADLRQGDAGAYVNFIGEEGEARVRAAYPGGTFERLAEIKRRYDPGNLFRLNQNIEPAGGLPPD